MPVPEYVITFIGKTNAQRKLINETLYVLSSFGVPLQGLTQRRLERMAIAFLAVADVTDSNAWSRASATHALTSRDIIAYVNENLGENISSGSYDDIRRQDLKLPVLATVVTRATKIGSATNDPTRKYVVNPDYIHLIRAFGSDTWEQSVQTFLVGRPSLAEQLSSTRSISTIPITIAPGETLDFGPGEHNELQKAIVEQFLPRYGYGAELLYIGDTADKDRVNKTDRLEAIGFFGLNHEKLPDIVAYSQRKNWLYLIEAVNTSGPISPVRLLELRQASKDCTAELVYVTAFLDRATFRKYVKEIAWETEVWIAEAPDHLIHFNGEKFLGPYQKTQL